MIRSFWKGPYFTYNVLKKIYVFKLFKQIIKIFLGNFVILPLYVNLIFYLYNGKKFFNIKVIEQMIGFKIGEFVLTRKIILSKKK